MLNIIIDGVEFSGEELVEAKYMHIWGVGTLVFRPLHGCYPKSPSGWYVQDCYHDLRPVESMQSIRKYSNLSCRMGHRPGPLGTY